MAGPLVIVESPAKAKKIKGFLREATVADASPEVLASIGHVRDLARKVKELPAGVQKEPWARLAIDTGNGFKPYYVVPDNKKDVVKDLRRALKDADALYLATDEDREGEAIAWHLLEVLKPPAGMPVHRMVFHEITEPAIRDAFEHPRELNHRLVDAQETRRLLDRLYGYDVSEVAWKKVSPGLSAGRVQSVATRLVVDRERERMAFVPAGYWGIDGSFAGAGGATDDEPRPFDAALVALDGTRLATGADFANDGTLTREDRVVLDETGARDLVGQLEQSAFSVRSVESKPYTRRPFPPFITSTLQQVAGRALGVSARQVMSLAQRLYEGGYITYMRTDSTNLSTAAVAAARAEAVRLHGERAVPASPRRFGKKVANAQEAHEAIRPAGDTFRTPEDVAREVQPGEARLYEMIWRRTIASQMVDAVGDTVTLRLGAITAAGRDAEFSASGTVYRDRGWMLVERTRGSQDEEERRLPALAVGDAVDARSLEAEGHTTKPPARFTEATLVARLEELGVGRPSTYASILDTIQNRGYVWKQGSALVPSWVAFAVTTMLERHFAELVDYGFTRDLEEVLDSIAAGSAEMVPTLEEFYFGLPDADGVRRGGLQELVTDRLPEIDAAAVNSFPLGVDADGVPVVAKPGRYGPYVQRGDDTASIPPDLPPADLDVAAALELLALPKGGRPLGPDPDTGKEVLVLNGRYGPYVQLGEVTDDEPKPKRASLFAAMDPATIGLDEALRLLSLPRVVGADPADGTEITAQNGRYGPYLAKGSDTRSLAAEDQLFTVTLDEALRLFAEPKRRGRAAAKPPLAELGPDPVTGRPMLIKDGRFGPYVTDGETNASLRAGDEPASIGPERAAEMLQARRDAVASGAVPARKSRASGPRKSTAKGARGTKKAAKKPASRSRRATKPASDDA